MSETTPPEDKTNPPPPAPPLPPARLGPLQRFIAPLGFSRASGRQDARASQPTRPPPQNVTRRSYGTLPSQTAAHRTGIPIAAIDVNSQGTHAVLAGKEILKTVRVHDRNVTEEFNLRSSIVSYASTHGSPQGDSVTRRREYLPARDVRWSVGKFDHIIATAAANGRIALYDVNAGGSRIELAWLHEHQGQVNKLDFDPFGGYWLLSASQDKTVRLWDIREPKSTRCKQRFEVRSGVREVRWSPKEGNDFDFAVCADGGIIQNWDARNPLGPKLSINAHEKGCYSLDWHPDGRHVVSGGFDKYVRVWDFKSENRRQKPTHQFRAPQAIRIIRWRPTAGVFESPETGLIKQTAQIATTYHFDDPRIHLWDFRRPLLPFRELDTYNSPANDFLWASEDLLWTVGDQGMFTQNDVNHAPQVHNSLPPSALDWMPDGSCAMFMEDRTEHRSSEAMDPVAEFLNVPEDRLSGEDGAHAANIDPDVDDAMHESLLTASLRRRQSRGVASRSSTSQANSPPTSDGLVQQLDKTILVSKDLQHNDQTGIVGSIEGTSLDPEIVKFLAHYYSAPATEKERRALPALILQRLEVCFKNNADVCDEASQYRLAQSWRMLSTIIVPELRDWAANNRSARQAEAAKKRDKDATSKEARSHATSSPFAKISSHDFQTKVDGKESKVIGNLFRGVKEHDKGHGDHSSSSNMTTPLARPVTDSPRRQLHKSRVSDDSKGDMDSLQTLPPSLLNSHSTASAAARALLDNGSVASETPPSSPEQQRRPPAKSKGYENVTPTSPDPRSKEEPISDPLALRPKRAQTQLQEEQRAALRDYRAQARPIFTLDTPVKRPTTDTPELRDSAESFPMFPASTSSSHKERSLGESLISHDRPSTGPAQGSRWLSREHSGASESSIDMEGLSDPPSPGGKSKLRGKRPQSGFYGSKDFSSGPDGSSESKEDLSSALEEQQTDSPEESSRSMPGHSTISSSPEMFHFDPSHSPPKPRIHTINPASKTPLQATKQQALTSDSKAELPTDTEDMASEEHIFSDFRPIDFSKYHPRLPFAWSSLPLICQMIAFDMDNGVAGAQFAVHLLLHVSPYFFSKDMESSKAPLKFWPESVAERLMVPGLAHRAIEALVLKHTTFLRKMHLFASAAEIRKLCAELRYERVVNVGNEEKDAKSSSKDPYLVASVCSRCQSPMEIGADICNRCSKSRPPCPVCLSTKLLSSLSTVNNTIQASQLWTICQACGHSAHTACMQDWLSQEFAEGTCPTPGCDCDCGPGAVRDARIQKQLKDSEESKLIRGSAGASSTTAKKDPLKASHSPAVDKTRAALRAASGDRGTQSSDERSSIPTRRGSARGSRSSVGGGGLASASSRKSVRLVTPGEERRPSESTTTTSRR